MRATKQILGAAVGAALALAACGGETAGEDPAPGTQLSGGATGQAFDPDRDGPVAPVAGAVAGGTVTVLADFHLLWPTMDPTEAYYADLNSILSGLVTRSLTQYVYDPASGSMVLVPDIATDLGTPNADFTEWSFTIRDGVRFEDGTEVTAEDVAYGIKRSLDRRTFPTGATFSNDYFLDGDTYKGVYTSGTSYPGVVVEGDTVTIKMERPFPDMPYWGAFPAMGPIPEGGSDPASYARHPLATGPYRLAEYTPGKSLTLVRNDQWDPDTDPGRHAYPDKYEFRFAPAERIEARILGNSEPGQTALTYNTVSADNYLQAQRLDRLTTGPTQCTFMLLPDYRQITDIRVRQAIGYAYPYSQVLKLTGGIAGVTRVFGSSILPPEFPGRQEHNVLETQPGGTDPDKAKALLRQAGYSPGEFELRFPYSNDEPYSQKLRSLFARSYEAAGFKATPFGVPVDELSTVASDPGAPINVRPIAWCSDWPSGSSWFPPLFSSKGPYNWSGFAEPAVDAEIDRIRKLPFQEQPAEWGALDQTIMTEYYPALITGYSASAMLHGSRIGGMNIDDVAGMPTWKDIHVIE